MGYTKYGEFMRILRVRNREVMGDTAKLLGCKVPLVSSVESGKKNVPDSWVSLIVKHYNLSEDEKRELYDAIEESKTQVKVNLVDASNPKRNAAVLFQRSFDKLDDKTAQAIVDLLNGEVD